MHLYDKRKSRDPFPTTITIAKAIQLLKGGLSSWLHHSFPKLGNFSWQQGYGAFAVSVSHLPDTISYIHHHAEHHRTRTFKEECLAILQKHNLPFEDKYLWN